MNTFLRELEQNAHVYTGRVIGAAIILVLGVLVLRYLVGPLRRLMERGRMEPATVSFLANSVRILVLVVIVLGILQQLGVETTSLLTVLAAGGLAVALSLQSTLSNFAAGLLLLSFRMLRVGDVVEVGSQRGRVAEIYPFHVVLTTDDNETIVVPNVVLTTNGFRNYSALPTRRVQWSLTLRPGDDLAAAKEALRHRVQAEPRVLREPAPRVFVQQWADDKRVVAVSAWTAVTDSQAVQEDMLEALGEALDVERRARGESETIATR
jgi:small conductance mechanosensitive channel